MWLSVAHQKNSRDSAIGRSESKEKGRWISPKIQRPFSFHRRRPAVISCSRTDKIPHETSRMVTQVLHPYRITVMLEGSLTHDFLLGIFRRNLASKRP